MSDTGMNGRISLRDHITALMSANDTANAQRFEAIQKQLDAMCSDHARDHGDHEERIRSLEKKGVMGSIADGLIAIGAVIAGVLGSRA